MPSRDASCVDSIYAFFFSSTDNSNASAFIFGHCWPLWHSMSFLLFLSLWFRGAFAMKFKSCYQSLRSIDVEVRHDVMVSSKLLLISHVLRSCEILFARWTLKLTAGRRFFASYLKYENLKFRLLLDRLNDCTGSLYRIQLEVSHFMSSHRTREIENQDENGDLV